MHTLSGFPKRIYPFEDLRLLPGHRLQLDVPGRDEPVPARLLGYMKGESLIVKLAIAYLSGHDALREGDAIEVRGFSGRVAFTFKSVIEQIRFSPYAYCHLRFPDTIQGTAIRHAERVRVSLPVRVVGQGDAEGNSVAATIANISVNGAMLLSSEPLGEVGDRLSLTFRFWILPNEYEVNMNVAALIQTIGQPEQEEATETSYGVKFEGMRSTESILLQSLIYQRLKEDPDPTV